MLVAWHDIELKHLIIGSLEEGEFLVLRSISPRLYASNKVQTFGETYIYYILSVSFTRAFTVDDNARLLTRRSATVRHSGAI